MIDAGGSMLTVSVSMFELVLGWHTATNEAPLDTGGCWLMPVPLACTGTHRRHSALLPAPTGDWWAPVEKTGVYR